MPLGALFLEEGSVPPELPNQLEGALVHLFNRDVRKGIGGAAGAAGRTERL